MTPKLKKLKLTKDERPLILEPDMVRLFSALGETTHNAMILSIVVQRIAHMAKQKKLNLASQELFDLFPFINSRNLRRNVYRLREYGIWKNKKYLPCGKTASYENIRINWKSVARLAKKVLEKQTQENEFKAMIERLDKKVAG